MRRFAHDRQLRYRLELRLHEQPFLEGSGNAAGGGAGGGIAIYTRRGNDVKSTPGKGLNSNTVTGYTPIREFYSPNYATFVRSNEQRDVRTTLYWAPQIITGKKNKFTLVFYNTDVFSKALRIVVEGMTRDGQLTHFNQLME